jgi:5-methylcytosine-specific restriction endonuclease McrA
MCPGATSLTPDAPAARRRYNRRMPPPDDWVEIDADPAHIARERARARELRKSAFWQRKLQAGVCAYCGRSFPPKELTMDHVVPVARGGRSTRGNVVPACKACNNEKKLLTPAERLMLARRDE